MRKKSITALISTFARAYHSLNYSEKVFDDFLAKDILSQEEYDDISMNMSQGISFFNPSFEGNESEALDWIVNNQLSPTPLARSAFAEKSLERAVVIGAEQYIIFASGYDSFAYRQSEWSKGIQIFEIDMADMISDKKRRLNLLKKEKITNVNYVSADLAEDNWKELLMQSFKYDKSKISFSSLLGLTYYLSKDDFLKLIKNISGIIVKGSSIVFDYPDANTYTEKAGERVGKQVDMANKAKEKMLSSYSYRELEKILSENGFLIYEHLTPNQISSQYFDKYNKLNPDNKMYAFDNVNYCLAVKNK